MEGGQVRPADIDQDKQKEDPVFTKIVSTTGNAGPRRQLMLSVGEDLEHSHCTSD